MKALKGPSAQRKTKTNVKNRNPERGGEGAAVKPRSKVAKRQDIVSSTASGSNNKSSWQLRKCSEHRHSIQDKGLTRASQVSRAAMAES